MLTIYRHTLWSQNVLIENFWSELNFPKRIINSFQTSWNKLSKLSSRRLSLTSETLYIQFHDEGTYELLSISKKPLKISNWNFTCIFQRHICIRKYQYRNFDHVPHLDPKTHGWSHILTVCYAPIIAHLKMPPYPIRSDYYSLAIKFNNLSLSKFYLSSFGFVCRGKCHLQMTDSD